MTARAATRSRSTKETQIEVSLDLDGGRGRGAASGPASADDTDTDNMDRTIETGLPFFDHMLSQLSRHGGMDLSVKAAGDLAVDTHHTVEDVAIVLGEAFREALGDKAGIRRFASIALPLDEALVEVALDLSGRPFVVYEVEFPGPLDPLPLGTPPFDPQLAEHFWQSFATAAGITLHVRLRSGRNTHHIVEAVFKAVARCLRDAVRIDGTSAGVPSTKGSL
jgi:imidazoleglycerol-phosphate dehydratase